MQRGDDWLAQRLQKGPQVIVIDTVGPGPVEPELVLHVDDVGFGAVDRLSRHPVVVGVPLPDPPANLTAIRSDLDWLVDRGHPTADPSVGSFDRGHQVGREGGYSASPR